MNRYELERREVLTKLCRNLGIREETQDLSVKILARAETTRIVQGWSTSGVAAAALYISCLLMGESVTQIMIAEALGRYSTHSWTWERSHSCRYRKMFKSVFGSEIKGARDPFIRDCSLVLKANRQRFLEIFELM